MSKTSWQMDHLLAKVYGPYPDHVILKDDFPRSGVKLPIKALQLHFSKNKRIIGFDETEYITTPPVHSQLAKNPDVVFFGVIEIENLDWLSEQGLEYLEQDFKEFDAEIHLDHLRSGLSIKDAYRIRRSDGPLLKIKVCCRKTLLAHFLTSKNDPEKLLVYSQFEQKKRTYWVQSLHVTAYAASRNFFDRYRLRALIVELINTDPDHTLLEDRNIDWILRRYFETVRPRDLEKRFIMEPTMEVDIAAEPRHLRHIPRAEIRGYFGAHAEWLLAHQIASKQGHAKLLDIRQWITFCKDARKDAMTAKQHHIRWGVAHGHKLDNSSYTLASNLARFGETEQFWGNQLKIIQRKKFKAVKKRQQPSQSPEIEMPLNIVPQPIRFQYDSDFSEPSTSEASEPESGPMPAYQIPGFCREEPQIPSGRHVWNCPGCEFRIDLLNLSPENMAILPDDTIRVLSSKSWKVNDEPIQRALFRMVSQHYELQHLPPDLIRLLRGSGTLQKGIAVKIEEEDSNLGSPLRRSSRMPRRPQRHED